jgi:vesicle transport through interaction with t-SNAREs 1
MSFDEYHTEFQSLASQLEGCLEAQNDDGMDSAGHLLSQCNDLLQQMALEARSNSDGSLKKRQLQITRDCKKEVQSLQQRHESNLLMAASSSKGENDGQREKLLQQQDMLQNQNSKLENARRVIEETEQVALEITSELHSNRETLESAHGRIHQVGSMTSRATRIVQSLNRRATQQKLMLYGMTAGIFVLFCLLVRWMR